MVPPWVGSARIAIALILTLGACAARQSTGAVDDPDVAALIQILKDASKGTSEKGAACQKLMELGARAKPAVPALVGLLGNSDELMRDYAVTTLGTIGPGAAAALPALRKVAAQDPSADIRSLAADAVEKIGGGAPEPEGRGVPAQPPTVRAEQPRRNTPPPPAQGGARTPAGRPTYDMSFMVAAFPELSRMPAPGWVKPGLQLTYYTASATIAGKGPVFQLDPQGGLFANDGSGRRYSVKPGSREEGLGGHGYGVFSIAGADAGSVAIAVDVYTMAGGGPPMLMSHAALVGPPAAAADLWVSPAWLKTVKTGMSKHLRVLRNPFKSGGATYQAVVFSSGDGTMVFVYDEATGILLYRSGSGEGEKGLNLRINGIAVANTPSRMLSLSQFMGRRAPALASAGPGEPDWMGRVRALHYAGQVGYIVQGSPNIPMPMSLDLRAIARGTGWVRFQSSMSAGGVGGALPVRTEEQWMTGVGQMCGIYMPPNVLAGMRAGQEIDRDPVTGFVTTVSRVGRGPNGSEMVAIRRSGRTQLIEHGYDKATGMLVTIEEQRQGPAGTLQSRLALRGTE